MAREKEARQTLQRKIKEGVLQDILKCNCDRENERKSDSEQKRGTESNHKWLTIFFFENSSKKSS